MAIITALGMSGCAPEDAASPSVVAVPRHVLGEPEVVSGDFGSVDGIRARPDGSLLVADRISGELVLADLDAGTRTVVGGRGEGPGEYRAPSGLWPLPGDSTLLVDTGNNRLTVLAPDLSFGATQPIIETDPEGWAMTRLSPGGIDGDGRIYVGAAVRTTITTYVPSRGQATRTRGPGSDSIAIRRIERADLSADTVARLAPVGLPSLDTEDFGEWLMFGLRGRDSWGVAPDGSVIVARASGYRVDWIGPDGSLRRGSPVAYDPVPLGRAEKVARLGVDSGDDMDDFDVDVDDFDWPETLPAFTGRILVDPEGRAWLRRHQPAGAPWLYDIFTPDAEHAATVETANGHTVEGFGEGVVYLTFKDEVDLVYIARHPLPGS